MARKLNMAFLATIIVAVLIQRSTAQTTHVVGGALGWVIPPGGSVAYATWAANQTFFAGDVLVFNFTNGSHDVARVTKADYDACSTRNPIVLASTSPASINLNASGEYYFICNFTGHCAAGQKLAINVSAAASSPAPQPNTPTPVSAPTPSPVPVPVSAPSPAPTRSPMTYTVGDSFGWNVPSGAIVYRTWAANKTFMVGDILIFNYINGTHNVAEVTREAYGSCNTTAPLYFNSNPPTRITLTTAGEHFYICTIARHCSLGQQLAINVTTTTTTPSPTASPPRATTAPSPSIATPPSSNTPSAPSPTSTANPPPPGNSATSVGVASLSATFLSICIAFLLY